MLILIICWSTFYQTRIFPFLSFVLFFFTCCHFILLYYFSIKCNKCTLLYTSYKNKTTVQVNSHIFMVLNISQSTNSQIKWEQLQ